MKCDIRCDWSQGGPHPNFPNEECDKTNPSAVPWIWYCRIICLRGWLSGCAMLLFPPQIIAADGQEAAYEGCEGIEDFG